MIFIDAAYPEAIFGAIRGELRQVPGRVIHRRANEAEGQMLFLLHAVGKAVFFQRLRADGSLEQPGSFKGTVIRLILRRSR